MEAQNANKIWWYESTGQQEGPISEEEIKMLIRNGNLNAESMVWKQGMNAWVQLKDSPLNIISTTTNKQWWYELNGERIGSVQEEEIIRLINTNVLKPESMVWSQGLDNWISAKNSCFAIYIKTDIPPPIIGNVVNNNIVWWLAFAPLIGQIMEGILLELFYPEPDNLLDYVEYIFTTDFNAFWFITLVLNIYLSYRDEKVLIKAGYDTNKLVAAFLIPVYLFKRAEMLKQNNAYFWVWLILFILTLIA